MTDIVIEFFFRHYQFVLTFAAAAAFFVARLPRRNYFVPRLLAGMVLIVLDASLWSSDYAGPIIVTALLYVWQYILFTFTIWLAFRVSVQTALFCSTGAYAAQHLAYKIYDTFSVNFGYGQDTVQYILLFLLVYGIVDVFIYFLLIRKMQLHGDIYCSNLIAGGLCVFVVILATYFNLMFGTSSAELAKEIYTLFNIAVILVCTLVLFLLCSIFYGSKVFMEKDILQCMVDREHEQFDTMKETIDIINIKCHDLKHQIRKLKGSVPQEELQSIEENISIYDNIAHSGNLALDTVLSEKSLICRHNDIELTYIADGKKLDFMQDSDVYSLFGNALDNAINAAMALDAEMRVISLSVRSALGLLSIHIENYYTGELKFDGELPLTTQGDENYHGFGMKSIQMIAQKYNGEVAINAVNNLFRLDILFKLL